MYYLVDHGEMVMYFVVSLVSQLKKSDLRVVAS